MGAHGCSVGEVVFNTAMTGYQEILTDPSYACQIVTLTYPHIGNTGANDEDNESRRVYASGLVVRDMPAQPSNWRSQYSLNDYLVRYDAVAIADVDTRWLTRHLRDHGAQSAVLFSSDVDMAQAKRELADFAGLKGLDLAAKVSVQEPYVWEREVWRSSKPPAQYSVVAYDFGIKRNILRHLVGAGCKVTVVPAQTTAAAVLSYEPDGVFLSNGPGDPEPCRYAIDAIRQLLIAEVPIFGICLGHQLLGLACGAKTSKMKFGHHGANHPVIDLMTKRVMITSQNHGFCIDENSLKENLRVTHRSLFDGTLQGIAHCEKPAFGFQGHPEASPGPHDIHGLFAQFVRMME